MNTAWLSQINPQIIYMILSAVVALLIWIEGEMVKATLGKLPKSRFFHLISVIDTLWFFVSISVLYWIDLNPLAMTVPLAYAIYTTGGWIYGTVLLRRSGGMPDTPEDLVIPKPLVSFGQAFSVTFFALCIFVLTKTY
ncbi:hypothetical protein DLE54_03185 [Psychrobacter sp. YP14]|uniref:hypothetical protein n=1 Tax=Psychrobacter sp. YP14 TaxID=2203895 RepID=UPI000D7D6D6B|nr:hypothetical protein [Psychrobacter sp. YP14]AWT48636.1 hypothetical protein DLE54_03185 [Psychrobacter sp. YP14]